MIQVLSLDNLAYIAIKDILAYIAIKNIGGLLYMIAGAYLTILFILWILGTILFLLRQPNDTDRHHKK